MTQKKLYKLINCIVLLITTGMLLHSYWDFDIIFFEQSGKMFVILFPTTIIVNGIKALRFYFVLYGYDISWKLHLKQYCKTVFVNMIFPFRLGELFRAYCYGYQIHNYIGGIAITLLDRFADTLALITILLFIGFINNIRFAALLYILLIFLISVIICYWIFPGIYQYWKYYLLRVQASYNKIRLLKMLERLNEVYTELALIVKGRCTILYAFSFLAWGAEIAGLALCNWVAGEANIYRQILQYLTSILTGDNFIYLRQFILISLVFAAVVYLLIHIIELFRKQGEH